MDKVYHIYSHDVHEDIEETIAICTSLELAEKHVLDYIRTVWCFYSTVIYIDECKLNTRYPGVTIKSYMRDQIKAIGKELGVYEEANK